MDTAQKLHALRSLLATHKLSGYIQTVHDEYMSEYPPVCNRRVEWLTGFSGSAGTAVVLRDKAALFTDGRYTLQAANEIDKALFEQHNSGELTPESWIGQHLAAKDIIGYDPRLYTRDMLRRLHTLLDKKHIELAPCPNLIDAIWENRPAAPATPVFIHDLAYAGVSSAVKRQVIADKITAAGADAAILTAPDAICWLLNIRARDVDQTPLLLATAIIDTTGHTQLFVAPSRCGEAVRTHLGEVTLQSPDTLEAALQALGKKGRKILCDPGSVSLWFTHIVGKAGAEIIEGQDPCLMPKALKNPVELQGIRTAHIRDGIAVSKLLCWLDGALEKQAVTEIDVCEKLAACRAGHPLYVEPSFSTISGSGPNGAIVHYRVSPESNRALQPGELFLLDSGGQYPDGTTDITRTVPVGTPSTEQKDRFTRVLKGHIALALAQFPEGTSGPQLDALARQFLWEIGLDYDHGTGHGVGHFLGVHEGPQRISKRGSDVGLLPGMVVSNEPGYYKTGEYGIRVENLVTVVEKATSGTKRYFGFDTLTCVPIDTRLVEVGMLTSAEKQWLNSYHRWVQEQLMGSLESHEQAWLQARCAAI